MSGWGTPRRRTYVWRRVLAVLVLLGLFVLLVPQAYQALINPLGGSSPPQTPDSTEASRTNEKTAPKERPAQEPTKAGEQAAKSPSEPPIVETTPAETSAARPDDEAGADGGDEPAAGTPSAEDADGDPETTPDAAKSPRVPTDQAQPGAEAPGQEDARTRDEVSEAAASNGTSSVKPQKSDSAGSQAARQATQPEPANPTADRSAAADQYASTDQYGMPNQSAAATQPGVAGQSAGMNQYAPTDQSAGTDQYATAVQPGMENQYGAPYQSARADQYAPTTDQPAAVGQSAATNQYEPAGTVAAPAAAPAAAPVAAPAVAPAGEEEFVSVAAEPVVTSNAPATASESSKAASSGGAGGGVDITSCKKAQARAWSISKSGAKAQIIAKAQDNAAVACGTVAFGNKAGRAGDAAASRGGGVAFSASRPSSSS